MVKHEPSAVEEEEDKQLNCLVGAVCGECEGGQYECPNAGDEFVRINGTAGEKAMEAVVKSHTILDEFVVNLGATHQLQPQSNGMKLMKLISLSFHKQAGPVFNNYTPRLSLELSREQYDAILSSKYTLNRAVNHCALAVAKHVAMNNTEGYVNMKAEGFYLLINEVKNMMVEDDKIS